MKPNRFAAMFAAALLLLAGTSDVAFAQPLGAPNSTVSQIGGQTKDHVAFTGGTDTGVTKSGGTIDGTVIGGTNPAAGTFTTVTGTPALTGGTIAGPTITGATISGTISPNIVATSAPVTANNTATYASVTGLVQTVVPGTYKFIAILPSTVASGTGGIKYSFHYVTTALTSIEATSRGYTAAAVATQHTTTTTDVADLFSQAAVVIFVEIEGTMVVSTGGTIQIQMAQNTGNVSNTIALLGGSFQMTRIS